MFFFFIFNLVYIDFYELSPVLICFCLYRLGYLIQGHLHGRVPTLLIIHGLTNFVQASYQGVLSIVFLPQLFTLQACIIKLLVPANEDLLIAVLGQPAFLVARVCDGLLHDAGVPIVTQAVLVLGVRALLEVCVALVPVLFFLIDAQHGGAIGVWAWSACQIL